MNFFTVHCCFFESFKKATGTYFTPSKRSLQRASMATWRVKEVFFVGKGVIKRPVCGGSTKLTNSSAKIMSGAEFYFSRKRMAG